MPALSAVHKESLPTYAEWRNSAEAIQHLATSIADIQPDGVLAHHPLRLLGANVARSERPTQLITSNLQSAKTLLENLTAAMNSAGVPAQQWQTLDDAMALLDYAAGVEYLAKRKLMALLDDQSQTYRTFAKALKQQATARAALAKAAGGREELDRKAPAR